MVNFVLVYKPYTVSRESEHKWTMYQNICVFKKVIASKKGNNVNMDNKCLELYPATISTISTSAIIYVITTIIVTIFTYLTEAHLGLDGRYERYKLLLKVSTSAMK